METPRPYRKIGIFRALQLGDLLCSLPAMRALRAAHPSAEITLISLPWARAFQEMNAHLLDRFIEFPGFPALPEVAFDSERFPAFLDRVRQEEFDLVIQMHGAGNITNPLVSLFGARHLAGFYRDGELLPDPDRFILYPENMHENWRHLMLLRKLGVADQGEDLHYTVRREDHEALRALPEWHELRGPYICLHPGARAGFRCWPAEDFAEVGDRLQERGYQIVITGSASERSVVDRVLKRMKRPALNLAEKTSLPALAALVRGARLVLCNDTGVSHLAVAVGTPSIVVFTRCELQGWPPANRVRHRVVSRLRAVQPDEVLREALSLLEASPALTTLSREGAPAHA